LGEGAKRTTVREKDDVIGSPNEGEVRFDFGRQERRTCAPPRDHHARAGARCGLGWLSSSKRILAALRGTPKRKTATHPLAAADHAVLADQRTFEAAVTALAKLDPDFVATLLADTVPPDLRRREAGFEGLASIIVAQQLSTASAAAIFGRLKSRLRRLDAEGVQQTSDDDLRACGLSSPKIRTLRAIADAVATDALDFATIVSMDAESAHAALVSIKGVGPWTADIFLLFCLGHADAWPTGDLALQEALRLALELPARPTVKEMLTLGERWRPLRGVVAHCLWGYYGAARRRSATPVEVPTGAATDLPRRKRAAPASGRANADKA
jgi:DNA-3-methyladenine glycosylase II